MSQHTKRQLIQQTLLLMRLHRPIPILLLIWPVYCALWIAQAGTPPWHLILIFTLGAALMRTAGCIVNDLTDHNIDPLVARTQDRPLANGNLSKTYALIICIILLGLSASLLLWLNNATRLTALAAAGLTCFYPWSKRFFAMPQLVLGLTYNMGVLMGFTAIEGTITLNGFILYAATVAWTIAYDTVYAMCDQTEDTAQGLHSSAIFFGKHSHLGIGCCELTMLALLFWLGQRLDFNNAYQIALLGASVLFLFGHTQTHQAKKISQPVLKTKRLLAIFSRHHWVGLLIFASVFLQYL